MLGGLGVSLVAGGDSRAASVKAALELVTTRYVLIHDAARPLAPPGLFDAVVGALDGANGVVTGLPIDETLKRVEGQLVASTVSRDGMWAIQTPQAFEADLLRRAHAERRRADVTDDAMLVEQLGEPVRVVQGSRRNIKVTFQEDVDVAEALLREGRHQSAGRIGHGYDAHAFAEGRRLTLGGVLIPAEKGLAGHSDADVLTHAITDAILGAAALGDLGEAFPATDEWAGASSLEMLRMTVSEAAKAGWRVVNVDSTVVAEQPRLRPYVASMRSGLASAMGMDVGSVSVKATTTDGLGFVGRLEGIVAHAVVLLEPDVR